MALSWLIWSCKLWLWFMYYISLIKNLQKNLLPIFQSVMHDLRVCYRKYQSNRRVDLVIAAICDPWSMKISSKVFQICFSRLKWSCQLLLWLPLLLSFLNPDRDIGHRTSFVDQPMMQPMNNDLCICYAEYQSNRRMDLVIAT